MDQQLPLADEMISKTKKDKKDRLIKWSTHDSVVFYILGNIEFLKLCDDFIDSMSSY